MKKIFIQSLLLVLIIAGCVNSTFDIDEVQTEVDLGPKYIVAAAKGELTLGELIETGDTVYFDNNGLLRISYKRKNAIRFEKSGFYSASLIEALSWEFPVSPGVSGIKLDTMFILNPGPGIKIRELGVDTVKIDYNVVSTCNYDVAIRLEFTSIDEGGKNLVDTIRLAPNESKSGQITRKDLIVDFSSNPAKDHNSLPINIELIPKGTLGQSIGKISITANINEPDYDYSKGYFNSQVTKSNVFVFALGLEEAFSKISGDFEITNPVIKLFYTNSIGIPMLFTQKTTAANTKKTIQLSGPPDVNIEFPKNTTTRNYKEVLIADKTNSNLPAFISILPNTFTLSGVSTTNPDGETNLDNIVFSDSKIVADLEVDIPVELTASNMILTDTLNNILEKAFDGNPVSKYADDLILNLYVDNGFPLGARATIVLYDSTTKTILSRLETEKLFNPAAVDANGKVTQSTVSTVQVDFTEKFLNDGQDADKMILQFNMVSTDDGSKSVKMYYDYNIKFTIGVGAKVKTDFLK